MELYENRIILNMTGGVGTVHFFFFVKCHLVPFPDALVYLPSLQARPMGVLVTFSFFVFFFKRKTCFN